MQSSHSVLLGIIFGCIMYAMEKCIRSFDQDTPTIIDEVISGDLRWCSAFHSNYRDSLTVIVI